MNAIDTHADLVFEGGGVKGIALAGALATLEEREYRPQNIAGTSAGAITAALLAAGYSAAELREIIVSLDYRQFQDRAWEDKVTAPVRVLWGTADRILEWPRAAERYRGDWLPHADWVVLDDVGHCPQLDVPLESAQLILGWTSD